MIKLIVAIGFFAVFGFTAYALVLLLTKHFKNQDIKNNKKNKTKDGK